MAPRRFLVPVELAAGDPTADGHATPRGWVNTQLALKLDAAQKGAANGVASLDSGTKVPFSLLPVGATSTSVAAGDDARLSNARTPTAHAASHAVGGSDDLSGSYLGLTGAQSVTGVKTFGSTVIFNAAPQVAQGTLAYHPVRLDDARLTDARTPTLHAASHAVGGSDVLTPRAIGARLDLVPTTIKTANYTAASGELVMVDATAGPITITLPALAVTSCVAVKKVDASVNIVTVAAAGAQTIGGQAAATTPVSTRYQIAELAYNTSTNWAIVGGQLGLTSLDARYPLTTDTRLADARTPTAHAASHAPGGSDPLAALLMLAAPRTATVSTTTNVAGDVAGDMQLTCTGDTVITPTGTPNGRTLVIDCLASGGARTPTMAAAVTLGAGQAARSLAIPSGGVGRFLLRYSALGTVGWSLDSAYLVA